MIPSESGVQQGDPLGPLLFALALQPTLRELSTRRTAGGLQLIFSYLDDCCLAGEQRSVADAYHRLRASAAQIGLTLNASKCEVIPAAGTHSTIDRSLFPNDMIFRGDGNFELLGGPIGNADYCQHHTTERVDKAMKLLSAIGELPDPQVALLLLRYCAAFSKLAYSTRVVPPHAHQEALGRFDEAVRECFESLLCTTFAPAEWSLATLSTNSAGLGLRSAQRHSPAAFLASVTSCCELCQQLDPNYSNELASASSSASRALAAFNAEVSDDSRFAADTSTKLQQKQLSSALDKKTFDALKAEAGPAVVFT